MKYFSKKIFKLIELYSESCKEEDRKKNLLQRHDFFHYLNNRKICDCI